MGLILCCIYYGCCCCLCAQENNTESPVSRTPQRTYNTQVARRTNNQSRQPLLVNKRVEGVIVDGVLVVKEVTTVGGITESGRVAIVEHERIVATDGTHALVGVKTLGAKFN